MDTDRTDRTEIAPAPDRAPVAPDDVDPAAVVVVDEGVSLRFDDTDGRELARVVSTSPGDLDRVRRALQDSIERERAAREPGDSSGVSRRDSIRD